jgi:molybdopterin molybdotransferase
VDIRHKNIKPYQIRLSNSYVLDAALRQTGLCDPSMFHLIDDKKILLREIKNILSRFDVLILSGGVSMGEFDYVPSVLKELGVKVLFHKVAQKPGKPFWFGQDAKGKAVFALPGNPVSTQICAYRYVMPYLHKAVGLPYNVQYVALAENFSVKTDLTYFAPVKIFNEKGRMRTAKPVSIGGSGDYASLSLADGFIELEEKHQQFKKGTVVPFYSW